MVIHLSLLTCFADDEDDEDDDDDNNDNEDGGVDNPGRPLLVPLCPPVTAAAAVMPLNDQLLSVVGDGPRIGSLCAVALASDSRGFRDHEEFMQHYVPGLLPHRKQQSSSSSLGSATGSYNQTIVERQP